ncbi:MAG: thioredoxin-like protein [Benjaminiella poitrasii]|nr:MAG: thioredoxin-like protein [Benjaminiella poitrasii]
MGSSFSTIQLTEEQMAQVQEIVEEIIKNNKIAVFSKSYCPYCKRAKDLLKNMNAQFFAIELDTEANGAAIQQYLAEMTGQRTVPNIFINEKHIGGCDDLFTANTNGSLKRLLA